LGDSPLVLRGERIILPKPACAEEGAELARAANTVATVRRYLDIYYPSLTPVTRREYLKDHRDFCRFLQVKDPAQAAAILLSHGSGPANALVQDYKNSLGERQLAPATVDRRLSALRSWVDQARRFGLISWKLEVSDIRIEKYRDTRGPGLEKVQAVLSNLAGRSDPKGTRDHALIRLMFDLGLRVNEVLGLDIEDLDMQQSRLLVLGKGRHDKIALTLPEETLAAVTTWLSKRGTKSGPLFCEFCRNGTRARLGSSGLWRIVHGYGLGRPHGLRHTAITAALDLMNGDVRAVQKFSRHQDIRVVGIYDDSREDLAGQVASKVARAVHL